MFESLIPDALRWRFGLGLFAEKLSGRLTPLLANHPRYTLVFIHLLLREQYFTLHDNRQQY